MMTDRLLIKQDTNGNPIVFVADSLRGESILACRPGSEHPEPFNVTLDYYRSTEPLGDNKARQVLREYEKQWGTNAIMMQRLPRVIHGKADIIKQFEKSQKTRTKATEAAPEAMRAAVQAMHDFETKNANGNSQEDSKEPVKALPNSLTKGYTLMKTGSLWRLANEAGESLAYTVTEEDALSVLSEIMGKNNTKH